MIESWTIDWAKNSWKFFFSQLFGWFIVCFRVIFFSLPKKLYGHYSLGMEYFDVIIIFVYVMHHISYIFKVFFKSERKTLFYQHRLLKWIQNNFNISQKILVIMYFYFYSNKTKILSWKNRNYEFWVFKDVIESCQVKM